MKGQQKIEKMYAFVCTDDDGTEGIPAFSGPGGMMLPMVGADLARANSLKPIAEDICKQLGKKITLCRFEVREELEVFEP